MFVFILLLYIFYHLKFVRRRKSSLYKKLGAGDEMAMTNMSGQDVEGNSPTQYGSIEGAPEEGEVEGRSSKNNPFRVSLILRVQYLA